MFTEGHSQLWDHADLDTSFLTGNSAPEFEIKVHLKFRFSLPTVLLDFQSFTEKLVFEDAFAHPVILLLSYLVKQYGSRICDMHISYEMVSNTQVRQLTASPLNSGYEVKT